MITLRTPKQIALLRAAGQVNAAAQAIAAKMVQPGVTTAEIDAAVAAFLTDRNATSPRTGDREAIASPAAAYVCVNDEIMNGVPGPRRLRDGDVVTIDIACRVRGWWADSAVTLGVGKIAPEAERLLAATRGALELAIRGLSRASRWSEVAVEIERYVFDHRFRMPPLAGHGIGRELHEDPQLPSRAVDIPPEKDFELRPGLVLAIEPTAAAGSGDVRLHENRVTWLTADGGLSAHFEHTVALTGTGAEILTCRDSAGKTRKTPGEDSLTE